MKRIRLDTFDAALWFGLEYWLCTEDRPAEGAFLLWATDPCVMLGKYQSFRAEVNRAFVDRNGVAVVRRMSGGGAIYTDRGGRQFSFIEPAEGGISFARYLERVCGALREIGFPAEISGRNDLLCGGRKFSGNAQYRQGGMCVHHGSLLFDTDLAALAAATSPDPEKLRTKGIASVRDRVCNLCEFAPAGMTAKDFEAALGARLSDGERTLTAAELARVAEIADARFRGEGPLMDPDPGGTLTRTGRFAGGTLTAELTLRGGVLTAAVFSGDVFAAGAEPLAAALAGIPFTADAVRAAVAESPFFGISREELLSLLLP